jgi:hypothetical protein
VGTEKMKKQVKKLTQSNIYHKNKKTKNLRFYANMFETLPSLHPMEATPPDSTQTALGAAIYVWNIVGKLPVRPSL